MRLCLYISIDLSIYGPIHVSIYLRTTFSPRPSICLKIYSHANTVLQAFCLFWTFRVSIPLCPLHGLLGRHLRAIVFTWAGRVRQLQQPRHQQQENDCKHTQLATRRRFKNVYQRCSSQLCSAPQARVLSLPQENHLEQLCRKFFGTQ